MTKNLDSEGLKSIAENYDLFYIDLWGVMHNGIKLHEGAIFAVKKLLEIDKDFVLLTNAPRPIQPVKEFLKKMGMEKEFRDKFVSHVIDPSRSLCLVISSKPKLLILPI